MNIFFQRLFDKYEINEGRIVAYNYDIFNDNEIIKLFKEFALFNNPSLIPLREICINRTVTLIDSFSSISETIKANLENILLFKNKYNISVGLDIHLLSFDASEGLTLCSFLRDIQIDFINFIFDFPEISEEKTNSLIFHLQRFCSDPLVTNSKICFKNFPFCFIPPHRFRFLYQGLIKELKGNVFYQRHIIKELEKRNPKFFRKCGKCRCRIICYACSDVQEFPDYEFFLSPKTQSTVVFVSSSLKVKSLTGDEDILCMPPSEQGDMFMSILEGFKNILIIDGCLYKKFPCTTFEVMLVLEKGINVFGSSNIGALWAVELDKYGMNGLGYVYNYLKKQFIKPYHIVAQIYNEEDNTLSTSLVSIIYFLESCLNEGGISEDDFKRCFETANDIHFMELSFKFFFNKLNVLKIISKESLLKLKDFFFFRGEEYWDIKKKDAQLLAMEFKGILKERGKNYVNEAFSRTKEKCLKALHAKYSLSRDLSLPKNWASTRGKVDNKTELWSRDNRELPVKETLNLAEIFFNDLDIVVADTIKFDSTSNIIINIFFMPFYFLERNVSSSTGNGNNIKEVLVSAYMELLERIPMYEFSSVLSDSGKNNGDIFLYTDLPQVYNWDEKEKEKMRFIKDMGYVKVTNILTGNNVLIPGYAAFSINSGSDGNASGNSLSEAVLYGIYELIERDVCKVYDSIDLKLKRELVINNMNIKDEKCASLIKFFEVKGCKPIFYNFINIYNIPCVRCEVYDVKNKIKRHGGTAVRSDMNSALFNALSEAYMGYIIDFMGIKDDKWSIFDFKKNPAAYLNQEKAILSGNFKPNQTIFSFSGFDSIFEEVNFVVEKLMNAGVKDILVVNNSPLKKFKLKSVKVIIPNLELVSIKPYKPSRLYEAKVKQTRFMISCLT